MKVSIITHVSFTDNWSSFHAIKYFSLIANTNAVKVLPEPTVRLQNNYYTVGENDGGVEVCAEVTTDQFEGTVQANYMTTGGSAKGLILLC